jgi:UDP-N-acetylmuramate: L-alanyl-gamma-D-glutamyl-meso-diaminopimelate ligase
VKVHFIAIGGSAMHNLAIALKKKGYDVTGSDDEIFEPAKSRLTNYWILPEKEGWNADKITADLDAVILGMHAKADNPELIRAKELGLKIYSYPEFLYEQSKDKTRIVIGGSHGKTTITAMVLHVLNLCGVDCDYMVGAQLEGFEVMVRLTDSAKYMILEGDEYLSSPDDRRPKFHLYKPDIALISGIAWDHINVFPTFENYVEQFITFIKLISDDGTLIYNIEDKVVNKITNEESGIRNIKKIPYSLPEFKIIKDVTNIIYNGASYPLKIFGKHNLSNLEGARCVCNQLRISNEEFYKSIGTFKGASKRLEIVTSNSDSTIFKDFAHSPSKLEATTKAVKEQFPERELVACLELHTYSSLNPEFLPHYKGCMDSADTAIVYFNPHALAIKKLPPLTVEQVQKHFANDELLVFNDSGMLKEYLVSIDWKNKNLLMMSSGDFDGMDIKELSSKVLN